ncbi:hypothetical protein [Natronosalvus vescus]|uniref:hypothetical protein n=1 Tax=Natronosalvus vescus TaxID=2953881 RepID=UPI002091C48A|nr:hypothetical protein [Natronosalvus vescus]
MGTPTRTIDRLRASEYTGANRCLPCTIVNAVIACVIAVAAAILWIPAGIVTLLACAVVIYVRGYLIPGTPALTARYLPERVLAWFDKGEVLEPADPDSAHEYATPVQSNDDSEAVDVEKLLFSSDIVEEDPRGDDIQLTRPFRDAWWRHIRRFRDGGDATAQLAAVLEVPSDALTIEPDGDRFVVSFEGAPIGRWPSDAAFYADLAVEPTLRERIPEWDELGDRTRTELIAGMRAFLEQCPTCDATLDPVEDVRKSCCSSDFTSVNVDCTACGARVFSGSYR